MSSWLWVIEPSAKILGSREKYVNLGKGVTISCELRDNVNQPQYAFWYHNRIMIKLRPKVTVRTSVLEPDPDSLWVAPPNTTVSKLTISNTRQEHAGNFTCDPSNADSDSIRLSVTKGKTFNGPLTIPPSSFCFQTWDLSFTRGNSLLHLVQKC